MLVFVQRRVGRTRALEGRPTPRIELSFDTIQYSFILNVQIWCTSFFDDYGKLCWKKLFSLGPFENQSHHTA